MVSTRSSTFTSNLEIIPLHRIHKQQIANCFNKIIKNLYCGNKIKIKQQFIATTKQ